MRVLVTGGTGYLGSHTCVALSESGHDIAILDNLSNSSSVVLGRLEIITEKKHKFFNVDIRDKEAVSKVFDDFLPEVVIHFAGLKAVGESVEEPLRYYEWNVWGSTVLLQIMKEKNIKKLVFSSSASVYGSATEVPIKESAIISPANPYGHCKAFIEQILLDLETADPEWSISILRYFNPIGAHESGLIGEDPNGIPNNLLPYVSQVAVGKLPKLRVFGNDYDTPDGTGIRDYIHVMDLAYGHLAAIEYTHQNTGVLTANLGTGRGYSVLEIVEVFGKVSKKDIAYEVVERRPGDVARSFADSSYAEKVLGWKTRYDLEAMCRDIWRWQSMNPYGYKNNC